MTGDDRVALVIVDPATAVQLEDVGLPGYRAAAAVDLLGDHALVLVCDAVLGDHRGARFDPFCSSVAHEQGGPLDARTRARVRLAPIRCGAPTQSGGRCRNHVTQPGRCARHRKEPA